MANATTDLPCQDRSRSVVCKQVQVPTQKSYMPPHTGIAARRAVAGQPGTRTSFTLRWRAFALFQPCRCQRPSDPIVNAGCGESAVQSRSFAAWTLAPDRTRLPELLRVR